MAVDNWRKKPFKPFFTKCSAQINNIRSAQFSDKNSVTVISFRPNFCDSENFRPTHLFIFTPHTIVQNGQKGLGVGYEK